MMATVRKVSKGSAPLSSLLLGMLFFYIGCSHRNTVANSDIQLAAEVLHKSFQQWKDGASIAHLQSQKPPVFISEDLWFSGHSLENFTVDLPGEMFGTNVRFTVTTVTLGPKGKPVQRTLKYLVTTTPAFTIAREDR